ncbi:MAG TPA: pyruvate kinase, partial [Bacteroidales bacterium]|nr:pyruvate kinase [Bacteroidales bacterium]
MRTKIVATLGPASFDKSVIERMTKAGVNVFRLNFSHGDHNILRQIIHYIRELGPAYHHRLAILGDLQGPKIRIGEVENNAINLRQGQEIQLGGGSGLSKEDILWINYPALTEDVKPGDQVLLDDGKLSLIVKEKLPSGFLRAEVLVGGILTARKGVNLPDSHLTLSALSEKDLTDLRFAYQNQLDWIALSFVRSSEDILKLRENIQFLGRNWNPGIIAKI